MMVSTNEEHDQGTYLDLNQPWPREQRGSKCVSWGTAWRAFLAFHKPGIARVAVADQPIER